MNHARDRADNSQLRGRRWYRLADRLVIVLLLVQVVLLLSERFRWFPINEHKGWATLIAMAVVLAALLVILLRMAAGLVLDRRWQFSFQTLFVFMLLSGVACGVLAVQLQQARRQKEAVAALGSAGATIAYDFEPVDTSPVDGEVEPPTPAWLRKTFGDDFFQTVDGVYAGSQFVEKEAQHLRDLPLVEYLSFFALPITDDTLRHVQGLDNLLILDLRATRVTDEGLAYLRGLDRLTVLYLGGTGVTDDGLAHLAEISSLVELHLNATHVTDRGLAHLADLTNLTHVYLNGTKITDEGLQPLARLTRLRRLALDDTPVTQAGAQRLQRALPGCEITY